MADPATLTIGAIAALAFTKFLESSVGEAAKKLTPAVLDKIDTLRQKIWTKLRGIPEVNELYATVEKGEKVTDLQVKLLTPHLEAAMKDETAFAQEVQQLANKINREINIGEILGNVQNIFGGASVQIDNPDGPVFQGVKDSNISITYNNKLGSSGRAWTDLMPPNNIPRHKFTPNFVGREEQLIILRKKLQEPNPVLITGMGGIGKTQLVLKYAFSDISKNCPEYPSGFCWLDASVQDIPSQILNFARDDLNYKPDKHLPKKSEIIRCWNHWRNNFFPKNDLRSGQALIIFDGVTKYESIKDYLPSDPRFRIILTTRDNSFAMNMNCLQINEFYESEALDFLKKLVGYDDPRISEKFKQQVDALCHWLRYHPLALELVGHYLAKSPNLRLKELQSRLNNQRLNARALTKTEDGMTRNLGIACAFEESWKALSKETKILACQLSCFDRAPIRWTEVACRLPKVNSKDDLRVEQLVGFGFIRQVAEDEYQFHPIIQGFIRTKMTEALEQYLR